MAWNYIDLRLRSSDDFLVEAFLTSDQLVVRLRSQQSSGLQSPEQHVPSQRTLVHAPIILMNSSSLDKSRPLLNPEKHSCVSCGTASCVRHRSRSAIGQESTSSRQGRTAFLVDECWPEYQEFVERSQHVHDILAVPLEARGRKQARYHWNIEGFTRVYTAPLPTLLRSFSTRRSTSVSARLQAQIVGAQRLACAFSRALTPDVTHLVVAQSLVPFLWRDGHLGGRTFEVLMTRLPLGVLHARLDQAARQHPQRTTLCEYRAPQWLVDAESAALQNAHVVTPHTEIASLFAGEVTRLNWHVPPNPQRRQSEPPRVVAFPGPVAARKGAYELRAAARELNLQVMVLGSELEADDFWDGVQTQAANPNWLEGTSVVVQASLVEDQPRRLLQALAAGVPVIATAACGLPPSEGLTLIPAGCELALLEALQSVCHD